jgi:predicted negative regulator of RcsB-dependent stress response
MAEYLSDEEQIDRLKRLIRQYGSSALSGVLLALIAYFGWSYWQKSQQDDQFALNNQYNTLIDASKAVTTNHQDVAARTKFLSQASTLVKNNPDTAYAYQTLLLEANLAIERQDYAAAEKALTTASSMTLKDVGLTQLALIRLARVQAQLGKSDVALASVAKVTETAFVATAHELKGDILLLKNDKAGAQKAYQVAWDVLAKRETPRQLLKVKMESLGMTVKEIEQPNALKAEGSAP